MKTLVMMAFRNIWRNKRRSLLAISSVAVSLLAITFMLGFIGGMSNSVIRNATKNESGHVLLVTKRFNERKRFMPVTENIADPEGLIKLIRNDPGAMKQVALISERIQFGLLLQYEGRNKAVTAFGADPVNEKKMLMLDRSIVEGRYLDPAQDEKTKDREIIVGKSVAGTLGLKTGSSFSVLIQGSDYGLHIPTFQVAGIFETGMNMYDDGIFQMSLKDAKEVLNTRGGSQQIVIMLKDYKKAGAVSDRIKKLIDGSGRYRNVLVLPWMEASSMAQLMDAAVQIYNLIYFVVALLGAFIITNIMTMVVMERRKEIGIIKSMGFSRPQVLALFLMEGSVLGGIGSMVGTVLGSLLTIPLVLNGLDLTSSMSGLNFPMDNVIKFTFSPAGIIFVMFLGIVIASLVSILPSRQAAKMNAVDAIKSV